MRTRPIRCLYIGSLSTSARGDAPESSGAIEGTRVGRAPGAQSWHPHVWVRLKGAGMSVGVDV
ncbi:hypothetical protein EGT50_05795 [Rhodococcus xishaensis]|uniref:Uncharacterized protein n=1 Tax=Rhodococcus xishaensis TaxID=2487364 RepID=A0A3S3AMC9_9NOCA|nr:hypothetical protein EGT50_05795 [Rhodococcus xishaensis]